MNLRESGFALLEVLITIVIVAFGLLGLLGMQGKMEVAEVEAYQRAQATLLVSDMADRMRASPFAACSAGGTITQRSQCMASRLQAYVTSGALGTGHSDPTDCSGQTLGAARDECEWSNTLKGVAETSASAGVGAMTGARGCVDQLQAPDASAGVCTPGIYRVSAVWQGLNATATSAIACGSGLYGNENLRRVVAIPVSIALPLCK
ncbi:MAG: type IV pilus modification protein PilV [Betaproteobacteria bacterium]|nr:MAG: type IV pilus modification protein PilV [Betaproteobacteria bacterium]